ncbi:MAG: cysteine desulfurase-like protein [Anaerolineae bacterium]|nr:cysteine desulfurase-like protein [Anaerolineae bacterium]
MLDIQAVRAQFPALHQPTAAGTLPVFLDNPAGTQVPQRVIDAVSAYYRTMNANAGGKFATSQRSDAMMQRARERVAAFLNAPRPEEIVFGQNMTTHNFQLSRALARTWQPGDEIVLTRMDHDANVAPWLHVAADKNLVVKWVDIRPEDCTLDLHSLEAALSARTKLVAVVHASNAVGTINPIARIAGLAHAAGARVVVDAVQSAPHIPMDVQALDCDFLLCSAYKFFGPHIGVLWGRYDLLAALPAYKVRPAKDVPPHKFETGTLSFETIHGVAAAIDYLAEFGGGDIQAGMRALVAYERDLVTYLIDGLHSLPGVRIAGITDPARYAERVPTVVFVREGYTPAQIAEYLAAQDIYVWHGNYYAQEIMEALGHGAGGMVRVGLAHYNTRADIDRLLAALRAM